MTMLKIVKLLCAMRFKGYEYFADADKGLVFRSLNKGGFVCFKNWNCVSRFVKKDNEK